MDWVNYIPESNQDSNFIDSKLVDYTKFGTKKNVSEIITGSVISQNKEDIELQKLYNELYLLTKDILILNELGSNFEFFLGELLYNIKHNTSKNIFQKERSFPEKGSVIYQISLLFYSLKWDNTLSKIKNSENLDIYKAFFSKLSKVSIIFNNLYIWLYFMKLAEDENEIKSFISENFDNLSHDFDFCNLVARYWNESQKRDIVKIYFSLSNFNLWEAWLERDFPYFDDIVNSIWDDIKAYSNKYNIPIKQTFNSSTINHAVLINKGNYDLVIWILGSWSNIPAINEMLWGNSLYIEWHRTWKKKLPLIKKVWKSKWIADFSQYKKILVCEHDVDSWITLEKIRDFLISKWVNEVDITFIRDNYNNNRRVASTMDFYKNITNTHEVDKTNLCDTVFDLYDLLKNNWNG